MELARALVADGARDPRAGRVLEEHAAACCPAIPALAGELLDLASSAGLPPAGLAARRAEAAALAGDAESALQYADGALHDPGTTEQQAAASVAASALAQRGFLAESIELYRAAGPEHAGALALALLAAGDRAAATAVLARRRAQRTAACPPCGPAPSSSPPRACSPPSRSGTCDVVVTGALSTLARSITLLEPVGRTALMPDTPAALSALVALHAGEFSMAESVLTRALATELGGPAARPRHLLLLGWAAMLRGRPAAARAHVAEARAAAEHGFEPRDELCACALEMGVARRSSDPAGMRDWLGARARGAPPLPGRPVQPAAAGRARHRRRQAGHAGRSWPLPVGGGHAAGPAGQSARLDDARCTGAACRRRSWRAIRPGSGRTRAR